MTRVYDEEVVVQRRDGDPEQFLWRHRLYVVRSVLAHWVESGAWWRGEGVLALTGDRPTAAAAAGPGPSDLLSEREVWRVEAGAGRTAGCGLYDLCFDWSRPGWALARVLD